jgi:predicted RNA-binding protein with RPS1 domain
MKKMRLVMTFVAAIFVLADNCTAQETYANGETEVRIAEIANYIAEQRAQTELWYQGRVEEVAAWGQKQFEAFVEAENQGLAHADNIRRTYLHDHHLPLPEGTTLSDEQIAASEVRIAEKENEIETQLKRIIEPIEARRQHILEVLLPRLEEQLIRGAASPDRESPRGIVTAIVYSDERPLAMVGERIVAQGDILDGIKAIAISPDAVKFSRDGRVWEQAVGENAPESWQ